MQPAEEKTYESMGGLSDQARERNVQSIAQKTDEQPSNLSDPKAGLVTSAAKGKVKNKKVAIVAGVVAAVVLLGGGAGAYFGLIVPNKPENIWKSSLERTAKGYDQLVEYANKNKEAKGIDAGGSFTLEGAVAATGTFDVKTYEEDSDFNVRAGFANRNLTLEGRTLSVPGAKNPDVYLKATGIAALSGFAGDYGQLLSAYDGQWISIDHEFLDNMQSSTTSETTTTGLAALSMSDVNKIATTVGTVNKQYIFNKDTSKSALSVAKNVGKETRNGRTVYHYKVGVNKENAKNYIKDLAAALQGTPFTKLTHGDSVSDSINVNRLTDAIDKYDAQDVADVYIDTGTKLLSAVRFTDRGDSKTYIEIGCGYVSGDSVPVTVDYQKSGGGQVATFKLGLTVNTKTNKLDVDLNVVGPKDSTTNATTRATAKVSVGPNNDKFDVVRPANAKTLNEVLNTLLGGYLGGGEAVDFSQMLGGGLNL